MGAWTQASSSAVDCLRSLYMRQVLKDFRWSKRIDEASIELSFKEERVEP